MVANHGPEPLAELCSRSRPTPRSHARLGQPKQREAPAQYGLKPWSASVGEIVNPISSCFPEAMYHFRVMCCPYVNSYSRRGLEPLAKERKVW